VYHFVSFGLTALVLLLLARGVRDEMKKAAWVFALGCLIESTQCLISSKHVMEWWDVRDDLYAVGGMFIVIQFANHFAALPGVAQHAAE
jgi:hypothetical protein